MSVLQNSLNRQRYQHIVFRWVNMRKQYDNSKKDAQIPQDNAYAVEIIDLVLDSLITTKEQPSAIARELFEFAGLFFYGPGEYADDYNYLDFDEASIFDKITTKDFEKVTKAQIETMVKALERARKKFL